jgi:hypothetical protein
MFQLLAVGIYTERLSLFHTVWMSLSLFYFDCKNSAEHFKSAACRHVGGNILSPMSSNDTSN